MTSICNESCELIHDAIDSSLPKKIAALTVSGHGAHSGELADATPGTLLGKPAVQVIEHDSMKDIQHETQQIKAEEQVTSPTGVDAPPTICWTLTRSAIQRSLSNNPIEGACFSPCFSTIVAPPKSKKSNKDKTEQGSGEPQKSEPAPAPAGEEKEKRWKLGWQLILRPQESDIFKSTDDEIDQLAMFIRAAFLSGNEESCPCCFNRTAEFDLRLVCKQVARDQVGGVESALVQSMKHSPVKAGKKKAAQPEVPTLPPVLDSTTGSFALLPLSSPHPPLHLGNLSLSIRPTPCVHPPPLSKRKKGTNKARKHMTNTHLKFAAQHESWGTSLGISWPRLLHILDHVAGEEGEAVLEVTLRIREVRIRDVRKKRHEDGECEADKGGCLGKR